MILQSDKTLNELSAFTFKKSGCAFFCLTEYAVRKGYYVFERMQFINNCEQWEEWGVIDKECTVLNWNLLCDALNLPYEIVIEGTHKLNRQPLSEEIQILHLLNPQTGYKHFCNADNRDNVTYDPLGESTTAKAYYDRKGYIISRRILRRKK